MAKIWRNRIIAGTKTFEECPARYQSNVKALIEEDMMNGVITQEQYAAIFKKD